MTALLAKKQRENVGQDACWTGQEKLPYVPAKIQAFTVELEQGIATGSGVKESWEDGGELGGN